MDNLFKQFISYLDRDINFIDTIVFRIQGKDGLTYLHNQCTNDVLNLKENEFNLNSVLDYRGFVVSPFIFIREFESTGLLIVNKSNESEFVKRLEKYIISEDVEISMTNLKPVYSSIRGDFSGSLFNFKGFIHFEKSESFDETTFNKLGYLLTGQGLDLIYNSNAQLFNNTILAQVAYDKKKGCFLGQEVISKIEVNRGASLFPCLAIGKDVSELDPDIRLDGRKVGKVNFTFKNYISVNLNRDFRINNSQLKLQERELNIYTYPLFLNSKEFAGKIYDLALDLFHTENLDLACSYLKLCLRIDSQMEDACEVLGVIYGRLEKYDEAIEVMKELTKLNPKSVMAHTNMSLFYMKQGKIEEAEVEKSNATVKTFERFGDEAARKLELEKRAREEELELTRKVEMFKQVLDIDPDDTLANFGLGQAYLSKGLFVESKQRLETVLKNDSKYSVAYLNLAKALLALNELSEAKEVLLKGVAIAAKNGDLMPANEMQSILNNKFRDSEA